jgi:hypothetical protein
MCLRAVAVPLRRGTSVFTLQQVTDPWQHQQQCGTNNRKCRGKTSASTY